MDEAKLAEIEAKSLRAVPKCSVCKAPARWTTGAYRMVEDFCDACMPKSRYPLERIQFAELDSLDLVAEVRRLTAALATARREGAEEMRAKCKAVAEASAAHATQVVGGWPRFLVSKEIASEIAALTLDAPGGAT